MEDQTNEKYFKNGKNNLNNFKNSVHVTLKTVFMTPYLIFSQY